MGLRRPPRAGFPPFAACLRAWAERVPRPPTAARVCTATRQHPVPIVRVFLCTVCNSCACTPIAGSRGAPVDPTVFVPVTLRMEGQPASAAVPFVVDSRWGLPELDAAVRAALGIPAPGVAWVSDCACPCVPCLCGPSCGPGDTPGVPAPGTRHCADYTVRVVCCCR
jgi:hypothetical protein